MAVGPFFLDKYATKRCATTTHFSNVVPVLLEAGGIVTCTGGETTEAALLNAPIDLELEVSGEKSPAPGASLVARLVRPEAPELAGG